MTLNRHIIPTILISLLLLFTGATSLAAQDIIVIGQVVSAEDGTPLNSAHVKFKRSNLATFTNHEGYFMLRSPEPQRTLTVSVVGYKTQTLRLEYGKDQMLQIALEEDIPLLQEIVAIPNNDQAKQLLKKVRENRHANNPQNIQNIQTVRSENTYLNLTNIKNRTLQRKLFNQLRNGTIAITDSLYSLPVYLSQLQSQLTITADTTVSNTLDQRTNSVDILPADQWQQLIGAYTPDIDPYRPYNSIMGSNFMNPIAQNASTYYHLFIVDSLQNETSKRYQIRFSPKNDGAPLLKGYMWVDSATYAITSYEAEVATLGSANFINSFNYKYITQPISNKFFPKTINNHVALQLNIIPSVNQNFFGAILQQNQRYDNTRPLFDTLTTPPPPTPMQILSQNGLDGVWDKIDTINQSRIQRLANWAVDLILYQYLHIWKIDLGPLPNILHYNKLEGVSPLIALRSGERFAKNFTVGGYYGWGHNDKKHKYGGQIQWRFGKRRYNTLSLFADHKAFRYGYEDLEVYTENRVHSLEHIGNALSQIKKYPTLAMRDQIKLQYRYEKEGYKFTTNAMAYRIYTNDYIPLINNGMGIDNIGVISLQANLRLSWRQNTLDGYFHRWYLGSRYPVVHFTTEVGYSHVYTNYNLYGKFGIYAQQHIPLGFGKMHWMVQFNAIAGTVPFPLLITSRSSRGSYINSTDFRLLGQMEFLSDIYIAANLRYQTRGYIFGYIPHVKKLGIREDIIFNIGYGHLSDRHEKLLDIPSLTDAPYINSGWDNMPYIECGFGLSNILRIGSLEFIWRLTHRNTPGTANFGIRWAIGLEL